MDPTTQELSNSFDLKHKSSLIIYSLIFDRLHCNKSMKCFAISVDVPTLMQNQVLHFQKQSIQNVLLAKPVKKDRL